MGEAFGRGLGIAAKRALPNDLALNIPKAPVTSMN